MPVGWAGTGMRRRKRRPIWIALNEPARCGVSHKNDCAVAEAWNLRNASDFFRLEGGASWGKCWGKTFHVRTEENRRFPGIAWRMLNPPGRENRSRSGPQPYRYCGA
jgi:hypothetical protein